MTQYEEISNEFNSSLLKRINADGTIWWIPMVEGNADYQEYLNKDNPVEQSTPSV